jgi:hypothetical protein
MKGSRIDGSDDAGILLGRTNKRTTDGEGNAKFPAQPRGYGSIRQCKKQAGTFAVNAILKS